MLKWCLWRSLGEGQLFSAVQIEPDNDVGHPQQDRCGAALLSADSARRHGIVAVIQKRAARLPGNRGGFRPGAPSGLPDFAARNAHHRADMAGLAFFLRQIGDAGAVGRPGRRDIVA